MVLIGKLIRKPQLETELKHSSKTFYHSFRNHNVDVSVAVSTDSGLITPIVFGADKKVSIVNQIYITQILDQLGSIVAEISFLSMFFNFPIKKKQFFRNEAFLRTSFPNTSD